MTLVKETKSTPRSVHPDATAFWATGTGDGELRPESLPARQEGEVLVRTLWTGVSRGTEALVARGMVPESEFQRMRAPHQSGEFPFPVKYGYLNVGVVDEGPSDLTGKTVFTLFPHQSRFVVPAADVTVVPDTVPARRAVLAGAVETAVNVLWDARPALGDRITVLGAGMIGASIARLARRFAVGDIELVDVDPSKRSLSETLGVAFVSPEDAQPDRDIVIDATGSPEGIPLALRLAATDGQIVVASWLGSRPVTLDLGSDFHSRRLTIRSSQVGAVATSQRARRTARERLELALRLLEDAAFDALLGERVSWIGLPAAITNLANGQDAGLCTTVDWGKP